jgi:Protein of unknown function (DUF3617)
MTARIPMALVILSCGATWAAAQDLNIRPGLWEFTATREIKGDPMSTMSAADKAEMEEAKAHMSPEQRAQMEAFTKSPGASMKGLSGKKCITKDDILNNRRLALLTADKDNSTCKITPVKSSATAFEGREVCSTNGNNSNATLRFEAPNPETLTARIEVSVSGGTGVYEVKIKSDGKWLGAACGNVKP